MKKKRNRNVAAWRDPAYRATLSAEERGALAANPAGSLELELDELEQVLGGFGFSAGTVRTACGTCITSVCDPSRIVKHCK